MESNEHEYVSMEYLKEVLQLSDREMNKLYDGWEYNSLGIPTILELELMTNMPQGEDVYEEVIKGEEDDYEVEEEVYQINIEGEVPEQLKDFFDVIMGKKENGLNNLDIYRNDFSNFIQIQKDKLREGMINNLYSMEEIEEIARYIRKLEEVSIRG